MGGIEVTSGNQYLINHDQCAMSMDCRIYEGTIRRGDLIVNSTTGRKVKVPRLVRMHADDMEVSRSSLMLSVYVALSIYLTVVWSVGRCLLFYCLVCKHFDLSSGC